MSKSRNDRASRDRRKKEALERLEKYNKLTPVQKVAELDKCGFIATKQRAKLAKQMTENLYK